MTTETTERDLIEEAEELLANAPHGSLQLTLQSNGDITAPDGLVVLKVWNGYDNGRLAVAAPELLRRLVAEVKALRRGEFVCQRCHHRKDAEFEPGDF